MPLVILSGKSTVYDDHGLQIELNASMIGHVEIKGFQKWLIYEVDTKLFVEWMPFSFMLLVNLSDKSTVYDDHRLQIELLMFMSATDGVMQGQYYSSTTHKSSHVDVGWKRN